MTGIAVGDAVLSPATRQRPVALALLIVACAAVTAVSAATVWQADSRLRVLEHPPLNATGREVLADMVDVIGDGLASACRRIPIAASVSRAISSSAGSAARSALARFDPREHPWRYACAVGLIAGVAIPLLDLAVLIINGHPDGPQLGNLAATAPGLIAIEMALVLIGYTTLGGYLGLRPTRTHTDQ